MKYLLTISIGPVQEFIAAARRTADLKAGSDLLIEIAKVVASVLPQRGLIFPADTSTEPSNKLTCEVEGDPKPIVEAAKAAAQNVLNKKWEEMISNKDIPPGVKTALRMDLAQSQIDHFLEFYAAWVPLNVDYAKARRNVERLLAGRKALRDFAQPQSVSKVPKSPLDPSRDCVLKEDGGFQVASQARGYPLWLKRRETLDAVSVLKRWIGHKVTERKADDVPSSSLMAARSILPIVEEKAKTDTEVQEALQGLKNVVADTPAGIDLGDLMFPNRLDDAIKELEARQDTMPESAKQRALTLIGYHKDHRIAGWRETVLDVVGRKECPPYYAILIADGDRMGEMLSKINEEGKHRQFSRNVAAFSQSVLGIVQKYHGYLVYHGGDDVLAFLPVNSALECAKELSEAFKNKMGELTSEATLSAGIAIVHHMDNLQSCLEWARNAEKEAKKERNSVAVALHTRGGEAMTATTLWSQPDTSSPKWNVFTLWDTWINAFRAGLSTGLPYELRRIARESESTSLANEHLRAEAARVLERKESRGSAKPLIPSEIKTPKELEEFSKLLVIARFLAAYPELPKGGAQ
jgi:CRISPR-associated protein Cmr2